MAKKQKRTTHKQLFNALGSAFGAYEKGEKGLDDSLHFSIESSEESKPVGLFIRSGNFLSGDAADILRALPADDENVITGVFQDAEVEDRDAPKHFVGIYLPGIVSLEQLRDELPADVPENVAAASRELGSMIMAQLQDEVIEGAKKAMAVGAIPTRHVN